MRNFMISHFIRVVLSARKTLSALRALHSINFMKLCAAIVAAYFIVTIFFLFYIGSISRK